MTIKLTGAEGVTKTEMPVFHFLLFFNSIDCCVDIQDITILQYIQQYY
jgi:hypothetical protein